MPVTQVSAGIAYVFQTALAAITWVPQNGTTISASTANSTVVAVGTARFTNNVPFVGTFLFVAPNYDGSGSLPSGVSVVRGSTVYAVGSVVSGGDTTGITSTGLFALVINTDNTVCLIINPNGPGVSGDGNTTQDATVEATQ